MYDYLRRAFDHLELEVSRGETSGERFIKFQGEFNAMGLPLILIQQFLVEIFPSIN
jgi:hypothetical protein